MPASDSRPVEPGAVAGLLDLGQLVVLGLDPVDQDLVHKGMVGGPPGSVSIRASSASTVSGRSATGGKCTKAVVPVPCDRPEPGAHR